MAVNAGRVSCGLCRNFCQNAEADDFNVHVWDEFRSSAVVPCNARAYVNDISGNYMRFEACGRKYTMDLSKGVDMTIIWGSGWKKFTSDLSLWNGDLIFFDMTKRPWKAFVCMFSKDFFNTNATAAVDDEMIVEGDCLDEDNEDDGIVVKYTRGATLNGQEEKLNALVLAFNHEFLGAPFVHRLTPTNIEAGDMKLPYRVAMSLDIAQEGMVGVRLDNGDAKTVVAYNTCRDGRIAFCKKDWRRFASKSALKINKHIFIYLKTTHKAQLNAAVVVSKL